MPSILNPSGNTSYVGELTSLQNSRYRLVVKNPIQTGDVVPQKILALGVAFSTVYTTDSDETAFQNLKLISQVIGADTVNRAQAVVQQSVWETLTNAFVAEVDDVVDYDLNGLKRVTRTLIAEAGTSTAAYIVGTQSYESEATLTAGSFTVGRRYKIVSVGTTNFTTIGASANTVGLVFTATGIGTGTGTARYPTLYLAKVNIEENDAYTRIRAEYLEPGVVSTSERLVDGGLKEVTVRSFYTQIAPSPGIIVAQTEDNENGYPVWTTTVLQKADGTDPTSAGPAVELDSLAQFTYPGRAKPYTDTEMIPTTAGTLTWNFYDVYLSPPVDALVEATTEISYTATNDIGALPHDFWNPIEWATLKGYWINTSDQVRQRIDGLRGYRTAGGVSDDTDPSTVSGTATDPTRHTIFGEPVFFSSGFSITVAGGPEKPDGNTYVLSYRVDPAFIDTAGTQYYRRTITYATIPAQDALPV